MMLADSDAAKEFQVAYAPSTVRRVLAALPGVSAAVSRQPAFASASVSLR